MAQIPPDAQRSDDGQWWWDGSQWQPVHGDASAQESPGIRLDWNEFPSLYRVTQHVNDFDGYLQELGIDPQTIKTDEG